MASEGETINIMVTPIDRVSKITINVPVNDVSVEADDNTQLIQKLSSWSVVMNQEQVLRNNSDGSVAGRMPRSDINRQVLNVLTEQVTLDSGKTVSVAEIMEGIEKFSNQWRDEDNA